MKIERNPFGEGNLYEADNLKGKIYATCTACMSIYSEFSTWACAYKNRFVSDPAKANSIIILSCQVTDLAVLNDFRVAEQLQKINPMADIYIGGCLARRFDIELPKGFRRLDNLKIDNNFISTDNPVRYEDPFWVKNFSEDSGPTSNGNLFRNMYPLRIGVGCHGSCSYCTIRHTRGAAYELAPDIEVFTGVPKDIDILLVADSPSKEQLLQWFDIAKEYKRQISIRNVEPHVTALLCEEIMELAARGLLKVFHSPVQHTKASALVAMKRSTSYAVMTRALCSALRRKGVFTATNVIIDYLDHGNPDYYSLMKSFDYISWNPYWNGKWDRAAAEKRFTEYFN